MSWSSECPFTKQFDLPCVERGLIREGHNYGTRVRPMPFDTFGFVGNSEDGATVGFPYVEKAGRVDCVLRIVLNVKEDVEVNRVVKIDCVVVAGRVDETGSKAE
jgi:hypothetical protein